MVKKRGIVIQEDTINSFFMVVGMLGVFYLLFNYYLPIMQPDGIVADDSPAVWSVVTVGKMQGCAEIDIEDILEPTFCHNERGGIDYLEPIEKETK